MPLSRRNAIHALSTGCLLSGLKSSWGAERESLVRSVETQTLWRNRDGQSTTWFHPRVCRYSTPSGPRTLMTLQEISGSDYFGPVHFSESDVSGMNWTAPTPIESLGRIPVPGHPGLMAGVCDVTPQYHPPTGSVLALGHVVFYRGSRFAKGDQLARYPVYVVRRPDGSWSPQKKLAWNDPRGAFMYSNNCGQRVVLANGDIAMAFTFGPTSEHRMVAGVRCLFDGNTLTVADVGAPLRLTVGRGLLEPSVVRFQDRFWMTIRAEDGKGYVSVSDNGLDYQAMKPWAWDDGTPLTMSTTQQHWLPHSDGLFLIYTRKDPSNRNVVRWRSPLWMSRVDTERRVLQRETERIVLPLVGDGVDEPDGVALMGNFHVTNANESESWVTVGEWMPKRQARGNTLLARIRWSRPNKTVAAQQ